MVAGRALRTVVGIGFAVLAVSGAPAWAQQRVDMETRTPPSDEFRLEVRPPALHDQVTRPGDADFYPDPPRVLHDPAFIEPFTVETETGRAGLSAWTAPQTPVGPEVGARREVSGWFAFGITITWGREPQPVRRPAAAR